MILMKSLGVSTVFALIVLATPAIASGTASVYMNLYPEYRAQEFSGPTGAGAEVGHLTTMRAGSSILDKTSSAKAGAQEIEWSNSYVGVRALTSLTSQLLVGVDAQVLVDLSGSFVDNVAFRDAFFFVEHTTWGRVSIGQMDSAYKEVGDRLKFAGLSSSNFISTSGILSSTGWKSDGRKSFHNRFGRSVYYDVELLRGVRLAVSYAHKPVANGSERRSSMQAAALYWHSEPYYLALAAERHIDWMPVSYSSSGAPAQADGLRRANGQGRSRDWALRLSSEWRATPSLRLAADVSRLNYFESGLVEDAGRFRDYGVTTWQAGLEWSPTQKWSTYAALAKAGAGRCEISGGMPCSTSGLGGRQLNAGVVYRIDRALSVFVLMTHIRNQPGASYGSAPAGSSTQIHALGLQYRLR